MRRKNRQGPENRFESSVPCRNQRSVQPEDSANATGQSGDGIPVGSGALPEVLVYQLERLDRRKEHHENGLNSYCLSEFLPVGQRAFSGRFSPTAEEADQGQKRRRNAA